MSIKDLSLQQLIFCYVTVNIIMVQIHVVFKYVIILQFIKERIIILPGVQH